MEAIEICVKQRRLVRVGEKDYALTFPLYVVADLEEKLGRPMKSPGDWLRIKTSEVQAVLAAGFRFYHPTESDAVAATISETLDPEEIENVIDALCASACPKAMARLQAEIEKAQARAKRGLAALPNVQSADAQ